MTKVTLHDGQALEVLPVPGAALSHIEDAHPLPEVGEVADATAAERVAFRDAVNAQREAITAGAWLLALPQVQPPAEWRFQEELTYVGLKPRAGEVGRKLDYIEYELLRHVDDLKAVRAVMYGADLSEGEVNATAATFPPTVPEV